MSSSERCDEIIRLIDQALGRPQPWPLTPAVAVPVRRPASQRAAERR